MKRLRFSLPALLVLVPVSRAERDDVLQQVVALGRGENRVMEHLDVLCNRFGPRLTGSDNLQNASEWTRDAFAAFGLAESRLEKWGEYQVGFNRGPWFGRMVKPVEQPLQFGTGAWTAGTRGVQRGPALLGPKNEAELEAMRPRLAGAWVLIPRGAGGRGGGRPAGGPGRGAGGGGGGAAGGGQGERGDAGAAQPRPEVVFRQKLDEAFQQAGILGRISPSSGELIHTSGRPPRSWDQLPTIPSINLLKKQYDEIVARLEKGEAVELEFDVRNWFKKGPVPLYNVIADLKGSDRPDEFVIVGGHIDSWDGASGAVDNGTGCAATLEAARLLVKAGAKPRRTIRFMFWSGEEQGLQGSAAWVRANPDLMNRISAVLVDDGGTNYLSGIQATEKMMADFERVFAPVQALDPGMPFEIRKVAGLPPGIGSDHDSFLRVGVPGFFWMQKGRSNYNRHHHTQFDTYDAAIPEYQRHSAMVIALGAYGIANLDQLLPRDNLVAARGARRRLGAQLEELKVVEVTEDTVAARGGLRAGDVILKVDGAKVADQEAMRAALRTGEPKKKLIVSRGGQEVELTLEWPPAAPANDPSRRPGGGDAPRRRPEGGGGR